MPNYIIIITYVNMKWTVKKKETMRDRTILFNQDAQLHYGLFTITVLALGVTPNTNSLDQNLNYDKYLQWFRHTRPKTILLQNSHPMADGEVPSLPQVCASCSHDELQSHPRLACPQVWIISPGFIKVCVGSMDTWLRSPWPETEVSKFDRKLCL